MNAVSIDQIRSRILVGVAVTMAAASCLSTFSLFARRGPPLPWYVPALDLALCLVIVMLARVLFSHLDRLKAAQSLVDGHKTQLAIKAAQIDAALDIIMQVDEEGRLVQFNQALCRLTGYSREQLTGIRLHDIEPPEFASRVAGNIDRLIACGEATFESAFVTRSGEVIPLEVHAHTMISEGRPLILSITRDIAHRKQREVRERSRLKILERIATDAPLDELLLCIARFVEEQSPGALCAILLADHSGTKLRHGAAPSLPEQFNEAMEALSIGCGKECCNTGPFPLRRALVEDLLPHPWWQAFSPAREAGLRSCWSEPVVASGGTLLGMLAVYHLAPALPEEQEILLIESAAHLAGIAIARVRGAEEHALLEEQLRHSQKIEAVGRLAAGVAHDFNNLLTPIIVYAEMLRRGMAQQTPQVKMVEAVSQAAHKASELTGKLLSFGRKQVLPMEPLDLNAVISSFHDIMRTSVRESISLEIRLSPGAARVNGERGQLEQVLLNVVVNAQDAISGTGSILLETGHLVLDDESAARHPGARPGRYVLLAVSDDGCGMSDQTMERIFEPFFTTKDVGRGTGLGLSTVYGIVKNHGGYLVVKSQVQEGSRFEILLPYWPGDEPAGGQAVLPAAAQLQGNGKTVLLVEDNEMIREMAEDLLNSFGYRVLSAELPSRALELAAVERQLDLLATDIIMPEMSGAELYETLLVNHPALPVLYISGYTGSHFLPAPSPLQQDAIFLAKPFTLEQFLDRVARMTGASDDSEAERSGGHHER